MAALTAQDMPVSGTRSGRLQRSKCSDTDTIAPVEAAS